MNLSRAVVFWSPLAAALMCLATAAHAAETTGRIVEDLSGSGWTLWQDKQAPWAEDELFAPPVDLHKLPVNAPTGGWDSLSGAGSVPCAVPGTAEEFLSHGNGPDGAVLGVTW